MTIGNSVARVRTRLTRKLLVIGGILTTAIFGIGASPAWATSINAYMMDTYPGGPFPATAPYWSHTANAVEVFGFGSVGCSYSQSSIESAAYNWVANGYQAGIEIGPQSGYGSISQYESEINAIA